MSSVILALLEHASSAQPALSAVRTLALLLGGGRINVLTIRVPPESTIMPTEEVLTRHQAAEIRATEEARIRSLHLAFDSWAATLTVPGLSAEWIDIEGLLEPLVGEWGRRSDFLVLNRLEQRSHAPHRLALRAALFDTDRPVLVVPPGPATSFGERVAIAWRDDPRTVRAVLPALRLLPHAGQVHVLAGHREDRPPPTLPAVIAEHGIDAALHILPVGGGAFGEALLAKAHALGADMLVMGAYTHSGLRQLLLGGVTRYMLAHADLPLLMRH
jgi:nucleotide-binding universal stress UspA family protein